MRDLSASVAPFILILYCHCCGEAVNHGIAATLCVFAAHIHVTSLVSLFFLFLFIYFSVVCPLSSVCCLLFGCSFLLFSGFSPVCSSFLLVRLLVHELRPHVPYLLCRGGVTGSVASGPWASDHFSTHLYTFSLHPSSVPFSPPHFPPYSHQPLTTAPHHLSIRYSPTPSCPPPVLLSSSCPPILS